MNKPDARPCPSCRQTGALYILDGQDAYRCYACDAVVTGALLDAMDDADGCRDDTCQHCASEDGPAFYAENPLSKLSIDELETRIKAADARIAKRAPRRRDAIEAAIDGAPGPERPRTECTCYGARDVVDVEGPCDSCRRHDGRKLQAMLADAWRSHYTRVTAGQVAPPSLPARLELNASVYEVWCDSLAPLERFHSSSSLRAARDRGAGTVFMTTPVVRVADGPPIRWVYWEPKP